MEDMFVVSIFMESDAQNADPSVRATPPFSSTLKHNCGSR